MTKQLAQATLASVNAYATVAEVDLFEHPNTDKVSIYIVENNVNAIKYTVQGTINNTDYEDIKAEAVLAKNAKIDILPTENTKLTDPWRKIRVQHKSSVAEAHGNTTVTIIG